MISIRRAAVTVAMIAACGAAAWGQSPSWKDRPTYDKSLNAVIEAGCERRETANHVRFFCEEGRALWYFSHEGRPEHPSYMALAADRMSYDGVINPDLMNGRRTDTGFGRGPAGANLEAHRAWTRSVLEDWKKAQAPVSPFLKRDRGKLYPLEP